MSYLSPTPDCICPERYEFDVVERVSQLDALLNLMEGDGTDENGLESWTERIRRPAISLAVSLAGEIRARLEEASREN